MANTKISAMTAASALGGTEVVAGVQSAANVKITADQIKTFTSASPALVTPALGTPASGVATNLTGTAAGLTAGTASAVAVGGITGLGTGVGTALAIAVGSAGAPVVFNGALGTPSSGTGTNITGVNAATLGGATFAAPGSIGSGTPAAGAFTTVTATSVALGGGTALANYLEGTPTIGISIGGSTTGIAYTLQVARYTRIGNTVMVRGFVLLSSKGAQTGAVLLTGLPVASANISNLYTGGGIYLDAVAVGVVSPAWLLSPNVTTVGLYKLVTGTATALDNADIGNTSSFSFDITYQV